MKTKILGLLAVGLLAGPMAANAVTRTYDFTVTATTGSLLGQTSSGFFSFDESIILPGGGIRAQVGLISDLSFSWDGILYDETTANTGFFIFNSGGMLTGFCFGNNLGAGGCSASANTNNWFVTASSFSYARPGFNVEQGRTSWSLRQPTVPEPGTLALLGLGLAGLGLSRRREAA